jgi:D-serine deaminase-like pyridoxal phosphate-dependent protein
VDAGGASSYRPTMTASWTPPIGIPGGTDTPDLVVDLDVVESNIARIAKEMARRGVDLRPHFKTHKSLRIARLQLEAGAVGVTCATLAEAEVLVAAGITDVFVAYPVWAGGAKAARVRRLHELGRLSVGIDDEVAAGVLGEAVRGSRARLSVLVEVDSGLRRSGVGGPDDAVVVARACRKAGLQVSGVFTHGGHGYGPGAAEKAARDEVELLRVVGDALADDGFEIATRSAGSTPTALRSAMGCVTEERPGTYVFGDWQQSVLGSCAPDGVALIVASTVVSTAVDGQFVIDAGAKTLSKDRPDWLPGHGYIPRFPGALVARLYDHHAACEVSDGAARPAVGEIVGVVPNHVCPVVNLARSLTVVRDGRVMDRWPVDAPARNT